MEKDILKIDSCIIGGSIAGLWTALELAKKGQKVLVIDKTYIGQEKGSIDLCVNNIATINMLDTVLKAQKRWFEIKDQFEKDLNIELRGCLSFALNNQEDAILENFLNIQKKVGDDIGSFIIKDKQAIKTLIKAREIGELVKSALVSVEDISLNNQTCLDFLRQQLIKNGAQFWGSDEVIDFDIEDKKIKALVTKETIIESKNIILASGARSNMLLEKIGLNMPLRPARTHIIEFTSKVKLPAQILHHRGKYGDYICKPMLNGRNHLIYTGIEDQMQATWSREPNMQVVKSSMLEMINILPVLEFADIQDTHTAQLAVTPDRMPYFGKTKHYDNLFLNIGLNGLNYVLAPYFAEKIVDLVVSNKKDPHLSEYNPDRFMEDDYKIDYEALKENQEDEVSSTIEHHDHDDEETEQAETTEEK